MKMLFALYFLFFCFIEFSFASCPDGSIPYFRDSTHCLNFYSNKTYFMDAEKICMNLGGNLVSIHNMFDNIFLSQEALLNFTDSVDSDFWIGANDLANPGVWTWMDGTPLDFSDWDKGQPKNTSGNDCGAVVMTHGKWIAEDCFKQKPFVCLLKAVEVPTTVAATTTTNAATSTKTTTTSKPKSCPVSWTYYNTTGFCYVVLHNETWLNAEARCKVENGHLASIHSSDEDLFLAHTLGGTYAWIGLFIDDSNAHWKWIDGTLLDYTNWRKGNPDESGRNNCTTIYPDATFVNWDCSRGYTYICKKLPD